MIDNDETISSQLQAIDLTQQYINLGINGAPAKDIICALKRAAKKYKNITGLIYVYAEGDFDESLPFGRPEEVVGWLEKFARTNNIGFVKIVFVPYIYNIVPNLSRLIASRGEGFPSYQDQIKRLNTSVKKAGFEFIDIRDVSNAEIIKRKTQFAALSMIVDDVHLSPYGVELLAERLRPDR